MATALKDRTVSRVVTANRQQEGAGFWVRRPIPNVGVPGVDPFLMIDEMGPVDYAPGQAVGAPDHPHRGFETVTYVLQGEMEHEDSAGHRGRIVPGGVQWMTAGRGVVHSEEPSARMREQGGRMHGFQIWVNLPKADKMMAPRYQELGPEQIPVGKSGDGKATVRVIAGEALGVSAKIDTRTPIMLQHWTLQPGANVTTAIPAQHGAAVYVFGGEARVAARPVPDGQLAVLGPGDQVTLGVDATHTQPAELLLLSGVPIKEPVAWYGPFVMNTEAEIHQAVADFQAGKLGEIQR
ncbi:MAG: pirin family protein [Deltaproteobacteria bacterium]|nr:pirin family protein [Deltaproteobacteria bacterium]